MTVCGVSIFGCCLNTSNFVLGQSLENQVEIGTVAEIVQIDIVNLLLYQSRRGCLVYASWVSRGHAMSIGVAMARV